MKQKKIKKIFIVDDDTLWTSLLKRRLNELGYKRIYNFTDGTDCLNHFYLQRDLIFLDYQMEDMNGIEVLQKIKSHSAGTSVVFCTAEEDLNIALTAIKLGSFDYLYKGNTYKKEIAAIMSDIS